MTKRSKERKCMEIIITQWDIYSHILDTGGFKKKTIFLFKSRKGFAKEAGMLARVFLSPAFTLNVKLIFGGWSICSSSQLFSLSDFSFLQVFQCWSFFFFSHAYSFFSKLSVNIDYAYHTKDYNCMPFLKYWPVLSHGHMFYR